MKSNIKKRSNIKLLGIILMFIATIASIILVVGLSTTGSASLENTIETIQYFSNGSVDSLYLSDIDYVKSMSSITYDQIRYDEVNGGGKITMKVENSSFVFDKGIWAHATSNVVYDISEYDYKYFTGFVGLNVTSTKGDGVKFSIYTSKDGQNWDLQYEEDKAPASTATYVMIDISEANYLRLYADRKSSNALDHAVYGDAKLVNEVDEYFSSVDEYDEIIKSQYKGESDITGELEFNLLKRELIKRVGQYTLGSFYNESEDNKAAIDWLMNNQDTLRYYILGGEPEGTYYNSLTELSRLYRNYKEDFENKEVTQYGTVLGDLYTRMAISLSLTHSQLVGLWMQSGAAENKSDSVLRYAIYRHMHKNGNLNVIAGLDITKWFESYTIEEMRFVMNNNIDDEEILWLNAYTQQFIDNANAVGSYLTPHPYIAYVWPNYGQELYYSEENKEYFNDLFSVPDKDNEGQKIGLWDVTYTIPGGKDVPEYSINITRGTLDYKLYKVWMNMRNKFGTGAVCGGISKTGSNIRGVHGIPSAVIGQPGHAAIIYYTQDANGNGYWNLDNDVSGWVYSEKGERMLLGWGNQSYSRGYSVVYMALAQEVINDNDIFEQSEKFVYLADVFKDDLEKQEETYRKALEIQPLNINAWYELINLYNASSTKTEDDYYELAHELSESLKYFPLPMYHLSNLIKPKLTSVESSYKFTLLQTRILKEASVVPNNTADQYYVYQPSLTRLMANYLLGVIDSTIATFSFDGEDAGKIVLASRFDGSGVRWDYSIDGKQTWNEVSFTADEEHKWQLTEEELASITSTNDIYIHIVGVDYRDENLYKLDVLESAGLPSTLYANDLEDKLIAATPTMMWKYSDSTEWTYFGDEEPDLTGDKEIIVKAGATGLYLESTNTATYHFTNNVQPEERKYVSISHLSIESVSSQATAQGRYATNIIDGNIYTSWHSAWDGSDRVKEIVIKLDEIKNITAMDYYPLAGGNGKIEKGTIYASIDGENYTKVAETNWTYINTNDIAVRTIDFEPVRAQYIKIVGTQTQSASSSNSFMAGAMFNFYENTTIKIVANFAFDGENAGSIELIDSDYDKEWSYSIDGGENWTNANGNNHQLTKEEINKMTSENGIKIKLSEDNNVYSINIKESEALVINPYVNDLENRLIGLTDVSKLEWKYSDDTEWTSYSEVEPVVKGNKTLQVRLKATGTTLPSEALEYQFTKDNQPEEMKYIPISHLSIYSYSTQSIDSARPYYAPNAIDGNPNTLWHTDFRYSVLQQEGNPYLTIKLDTPRNISALEFIQKKYRSVDPDDIKNAIVYVSMDGENWVEAGRIENCPQDNELRQIIFEESVRGQFVKLEMETYNIFASIAMINLYEDVSQDEANVSIEYDITNITNEDVIATLVSDDDITIINNNGKNAYTFTENGTFTFIYEDKTGEEKSITAVVDWIDKESPIGTINYSVRDVTNENVIATLTTNEDVTITNNNGSNTYTFEENGDFTFEYVDAAGNKGSSTASVTWINKNAPIGTLSYSESTLTNQDVVVTLRVNSDIIITNNNGSNKYTFTENGIFTFEFTDAIGNRGTASAIVDWIDKTAPTATVEYSTTELTNQDVVATLKDFSEEVEILNNNGIAMHTFTENGEFTFEIQDKVGNLTKITVSVDNIDKTAPTASVEYSTTELTNQDVEVTIKDFSEEITILNNDGKDTYVFTENGTFTFEIQDKAGNISKIEATVNNINKATPKATVEYSTTELTNQNVVVTLTSEDDITILNNNGSTTYTFEENGEFTFEFVNKAGVKNSVVAKVNWIDKTIPTAKAEYSTTELTNQDVVATLKEFSEDVEIVNNNGKDSYLFTENGEFVFEFVDKAGNKGTLVVKVDWIDKIAPKASLKYNITSTTSQNVTVTLTDYSEEITIINNNGLNLYTFTENGTFDFIIEDKAGNRSTIQANVNWINTDASGSTKPTQPLDKEDSANTVTSPNGTPSSGNSNINSSNNQGNASDAESDNVNDTEETDNSSENDQNENQDTTEPSNDSNDKEDKEDKEESSNQENKINHKFNIIILIVISIILFVLYKNLKKQNKELN